MTFEEFYHKNPHYTYLVAKIHYNILKDKAVTTTNKTYPKQDEFVCENCSS